MTLFCSTYLLATPNFASESSMITIVWLLWQSSADVATSIELIWMNLIGVPVSRSLKFVSSSN